MSLPIIHLLLLSLAVAGSRDRVRVIEIESALNELRSMNQSGPARLCEVPGSQNTESADLDRFLNVTDDDDHWILSDCVDSNLTQGSTCSRGISICSENTSSLNCWSPSSSQRFQSVAARRAIYQYARNKFLQITSNRVLQNRCCFRSHNPDLCRTSFQNTGFALMIGLPPGNMSAWFRQRYVEIPPSRGQVEISEGMLLGCRTASCIDRLLFHELGHACEYARADNLTEFNLRTAAARSDPNCTLGTETTASVSDIQDVFGEEFNQCINREIQLHSEVPGCYSSRILEIFATSIFFDQVEPSGMAWDCTGPEDSDHLSTRKILHCIFRIPRTRGGVCTQNDRVSHR